MAEDLWPKFIEQYPDHASALNERYANTSNYSAKSWFAMTLQRYAAARHLIEDTGEWGASSPDWGYPRQRIYRGLPAASL